MADTIGVSTQSDGAPEIGKLDEGRKRSLKQNLEQYEQLFGADEDAFDQPTTTRKELWSYYLYYNVSFPHRYLSH